MRRRVSKANLAGKRAEKQNKRTRASRFAFSGDLPKRMFSLLLCLCVMMTMLCDWGGWTVSAAAESTQNVMSRIADGNTMDTYIGKLLSSEWGSRYAGRVWTDKSVFANGTEIGLDMQTDGYEGKVNFNSDFGTVFSALTSSQRINEYPPCPIDLVILIDMSGSMAMDIVDPTDSHEDYDQSNSLRISHSRIYAVLESINKTIKEVMDIGEASRVAVVGYGATAHTLMELGHYETPTEGKYLEVGNFRAYGGDKAPDPLGSKSAAYMVGTIDGLTKLDESTGSYASYSRHARNDYVDSGVVTDDPDDTISIGFHTDLQAGIYQGFEELYKNYKTKEDVTKTYITGETKSKVVVQRIPVAIVMTDGGSNYALQPTTGAIGDEWYNVPVIKNNNVTSYTGTWEKYRTEATGVGKGGDATILDILMTASYEKSKVQKKYEKYVLEAKADKDNPLEEGRFKGTDFRILTVSVDTPDTEWQKPRVYAALDPVHFFSDNLQANNDIDPNTWDQKQDVINAYNLFKEWEKSTGTVSTTFNDLDASRTVKFNQLPDAVSDIDVTKEDVVKNINYNTRFADISSSALTDTFDNMLNEIRGIAFTPLSGDNASGVADSVTYQDPLGEYMELKHGAITVNGAVAGSTNTTFDMSVLLLGEMHGLVRAGVYDYQWNDKYMSIHGAGTHGQDRFPMGWYKGEDAATAYKADGTKNDDSGSWPEEDPVTHKTYATAEDAWADGWVMRFDFQTLLEFVPIANAPKDGLPQNLDESVKKTTYTCYRFADSQAERNKLRCNPIFGDVPDSLQKEWDDYFKEHGSYPVGMGQYSDYPGVYRLSDIRVWAEHTGDYIDQAGSITPEDQSGYDDSLYLNLPMAAVPTQLAEITLGADGPISYKDNLADRQQCTPFRVFYAVGLTEDLILRDAEGNQTGVDIAKISGEYISTHSDPETSNVWFISNWYSNTAYWGYTSDDEESYRTRGDAAATFSPATANRYYLFQKPIPLIAHAYRVLDADGNVAPVDNADNKDWGADGSGNGSSKWETVDDVDQSAASWVGGEFIGTYDNDASFKAALAEALNNTEEDGVSYIEDDKGNTYRIPDDITDAIITYTSDQLSKVDSDASGGYTGDSNSFSSDDYFFLCIEYYLPMGGVGKDIYGQEDPATQAVRKVNRMIARKGSAFGSGLQSANINNGDMLCWYDINGRCNLEIEYNSRTDTGDDTRGRPTLEKLTYENGRLLEYLQGLGLKTEPTVEVKDPITGAVEMKSYLDLDYEYWQSVQADPYMQGLIRQITESPDQQAKFDELFDWSVSAKTGGIRVGDMYQNMQAKGGGGDLVDGYYEGNVTKTANNYYIPTLSETSTAGDGLVINNFLGNNGRMEIANATLMVTKTLVAPDGYKLTTEQQNETFDYQVYVQGLTGERLAQRLKWNPFSQSWQKRVETLDILTDNASLLLDTSGSRALFCYTGGMPRQIVEVIEDDGPKYYYADATGAATSEPCNDPTDHFYYLYLPGSAGDLNYHLFASTYEGGTTELEGVGTTAYYPTGMDTSQLPAGDNDSQEFVQEITGSPNPLADRPAGSREYWTAQAELIPYDEVQAESGQHWDYSTSSGQGHLTLEQFTLVTVIPDPNGTDSTVYSPFSSRTQYMTLPLYFGYKADLAEHLKNENEAFADCKHLNEYKLDGMGLYDQIIPSVDRPDLFNSASHNATPADMVKNTAEYTLRSGEGLFLTGLGNRITYRFTEKLTDTQIEQGYTLKEISHVQQRGSDSVYRPGVQKIPVYSYEGATFNSEYYPEKFWENKTAYGLTWAIKQDGTPNNEEYLKYEPFAHTNAVMWEYYATMGENELGNHHHPVGATGTETSNFFTYEGIVDGLDTYTEHKDPGDIDAIDPNPSCVPYNSETGKGCDVDMGDGTTRHYMYREGVLIDPHYEGEGSAYLRFMSRGGVSPTVHFGVEKEVVKNGPAEDPAGDRYDYNGVYSVFGNTGYFSEQAHYTNTIDPELFVLTKDMKDVNGEDVPAPPDQEFSFTLTFEPTDSAAMTDVDNTLHYWKGDKDTLTSSLTWTDEASKKTYKMPEHAPKLDEYEQYLTGEDFRLATIRPEGDGSSRTYKITLRANEAIVLYGLIAGTDFTVTEEKNERYPVVPDGKYTQTGTIVRTSEDARAMDPELTPNRAEFINQLKDGLLTVEKKVLGEDPDTEKVFGFTVTLTAKEGETLDKAALTATLYKGADDTTGGSLTLDWKETRTEAGVTELTATFNLKHGEKVSIDGIPIGTMYNVKEAQRGGYNLQHVAGNPQDDPNAGGTYLSLKDDSVSGSITTNAVQAYLLFANEKAPSLPFVGGLGWTLLYILGALLLSVSSVVFVHRRRRRRLL